MKLQAKQGANPWSLLSLLGLLSLVSLFTGDERWSSFAGFLAFLGLARFTPDERFHANVARAGRNAFFAAMLGVWALLGLLTWRPSVEAAINTALALHLLLPLVFAGSLWLYERRAS